MALLKLRGTSNLELFGPFLPPTSEIGQQFDIAGPAAWADAGYPISVQDQYALSLHNKGIQLAEQWQGAELVDLGVTWPATITGFRTFLGSFLAAAAEAYGAATGRGTGTGWASRIATMVSHRAASTDYLGSLARSGGPTKALVDVGLIDPALANIAVTDTAGKDAVVIEVVTGTQHKVGDVIDIAALRREPTYQVGGEAPNEGSSITAVSATANGKAAPDPAQALGFLADSGKVLLIGAGLLLLLALARSRG
jgi:hypothetical protein